MPSALARQSVSKLPIALVRLTVRGRQSTLNKKVMDDRERLYLAAAVDEFREFRDRAMLGARLLPEGSDERKRQIQIARRNHRFVWRGEEMLSKKSE